MMLAMMLTMMHAMMLTMMHATFSSSVPVPPASRPHCAQPKPVRASAY